MFLRSISREEGAPGRYAPSARARWRSNCGARSICIHQFTISLVRCAAKDKSPKWSGANWIEGPAVRVAAVTAGPVAKLGGIAPDAPKRPTTLLALGEGCSYADSRTASA